jgi:hypothetical protein
LESFSCGSSLSGRKPQARRKTMQNQIIKLILICGGIWLILDAIYGEKRIEKFINKVVG